MKLDTNTNRCCICEKDFAGYGNNPDPVSSNPDDRCCDRCNGKVVVPARMTIMALISDLNAELYAEEL